MKQFLFELKKLHRRKAYLVVCLAAIVMSLWTIQTIEYPFFFNPLLEYQFSTSEAMYEEFAMPLFIKENQREITDEESAILREYESVSETSKAYQELRNDLETSPETSKSFLEAKLSEFLF